MRGVKYPSVGMMLFCVSVPAFSAVETGLTAGVTGEWTDNVFYSAGERRNDWRETLNLGANLNGAETVYQYGIDYNVAHDRYQRDSYDPITNYDGTAFLNLSLLPGRFEWYSSVTSSTTLLEGSGADTPDNRDQRDQFLTSPRLALIALPRDRVLLSGEAEKIQFRESEQSDSDRVGGDLAWTHLLSPLLDLTASASLQQVDFDLAEDYDSTNYRMGFVRRINGGSFGASVGQTTLTPEFSEEFDGLQYEANFNWGVDRHSVYAQASRDLTDSSVGLQSESLVAPGLETQDADTNEVDLVTMTYFTLGYGYTVQGSFAFNLNVYHDEEASEDESRDIVRDGVGFIATRELGPEMRASFEFNYQRYDSHDQVMVPVDQVDYTRSYRLSLERDFYEQLTARLWLGREESDREVALANYEVHVVGATCEVRF